MRLWLFTTLVLLLALFHHARADAKGRFERVTVVVPGATAEIQVTDPELLDFFSFSRFPDQRLAAAPAIAIQAYIVTRGAYTPDGVFRAFDRLHYYPSSAPGAPGHVYYDGLVNGWSEYDKQWYRASPQGDRAMSRFIAMQALRAHGGRP
ncbi:MAG TPA: hypothetical protein VIC28_12515 [Thermoanaerobaculia bacterium]|jgi:hypothetical protein